MNPMLKVSAAVLIAAMSVAPVLASVDSAAVVIGLKAEIVPVATLDAMIGKWTAADITALDKATSIKLFDTKTLYAPADLTLIGASDTKMVADLGKLHTALEADAGLKAWFAKNKIDVNRVVAINDVNGAVEMFLY